MQLDGYMLSTISSILEVVFILFFVIAAFGLAIAARVGYKRGIYKSSYKLFGLILMIALALITVKPFVNFVLKFDLSGFVTSPITCNITLGDTPISFSANVTTVEATLDDLIRSFLNSIGAIGQISDVTSLVKTLVICIVSFVVYILDLFLIFGIGSGILELFWVLIFKKAAPKIANKLGKIKVVGMVETMVSYIIVLFLIMTPLTSIVNSINQGVQKSKMRESENETVQDIIQLVDIYNDSLFARTFFNWNADLNENNMTFDTYLMDFFVNIANDNESNINFCQDVEKIVAALGNVVSGFGPNGEDGMPTIASADVIITSAFDLFTASDLFTSLLEVSIKVALDSDALTYFIPNSEYYERVNVDNVNLDEEMQILKSMATDLANSGIIDDYIDFNTNQLSPISSSTDKFIEFLDDLFTAEENREKVNKLFSVLNRLDDLTLVNNAIQALGYWAVTNDGSYTILKLLGGEVNCENPYAIESNKTLVNNFISDIHFGEEIHTILDACWGIASCGDHIIKNAYYAFSEIPESNSGDSEIGGSESNLKFRANAETEDLTEEYEKRQSQAKSDLLVTLQQNETLDKFRDCITGVAHMNEDGTPKNRDAAKGEHYALLDSKIVTKILNTTDFSKKLFDNFDLGTKFGLFAEKAKTNWLDLMDDVYSDSSKKPIVFFKNEIDFVLNVFTNIAKLKNPNESSSSTLVPLGRHNEEIVVESEEDSFNYVDYDSFLEAIINQFDGWINPDDIPGSLFSLDSRFAPYISELFKCLKPLDNSRIVKAIGIPLITSKLEDMKELTQDYFDIDICINEIEKCDNFFEVLSDFLNATTVKNLQHFVSGLLLDANGNFDVAVISDDPVNFLEKLNDNLVLAMDDPFTSENETVYDDKPLKYYFAEVLKSLYNFKIFNPQTGEYANKNIQHLFDFVFLQLESFNVERPSDDVYESLNAPGKWEAELTSITELFAILGKNQILNIGDYSSNINSALLYSLAGDTAKARLCDDYDSSMPTNLGEVFDKVGDSVMFSSIMGGLLDGYLDGTLCDTSIGVQYSNIKDGSYWHEEGANMNKLLESLAVLDLDLQNLDFTKVTDVVGLNEMLHNLSDSLIFKNEGTNKFGEWLFTKTQTAMDSMSEGLLDDPQASVWDSSWDAVVGSETDAKYPSQRIAYFDFTVRDGANPDDYEANKAGWCDAGFETKLSTFKTAKNYNDLSKEEKNDLYKSKTFMNDYYNDVLQYDEIGRVVNVLGQGIRIMDGNSEIDFDNLSADDLDSLMTAVNNTNCLRIASYNSMKLAKNNIGTNDFVDIELADFDYLICAESSLTNYNLGRENRQIEINHIVSFYDSYKKMQAITGDDIESSAFFEKANLQELLGVDENGIDVPGKEDLLTNMLCELESTQCFNLQKVKNRTSNELSFFESMMVKIMEESGLKELTDIPETDTTTMEERIIRVSDCEYDGTLNAYGYNSCWTERDGNEEVIGGECKSLTGVLKSVLGSTKDSSVDAVALSLTNIPSSETYNMMKSINGSYLCTGVMRHFVIDAFTGNLGLEAKLKYDPSDADMVANFDIDYIDYGGANNECIEGTEIYCLQQAIAAMQYQNTSGEYEFVSLSNLSGALNYKPDCFDGVFYYLYNSKILEEQYSGNTDITGRDILLYNTLSNFDSYLIGNNKENKILSIAKVFETTKTLGDDYYKVESNGITRIIDAAGNTIENVNVDSLRNDASKKEMILKVVQYTYDRNDGNLSFTTDTEVTTKRAYFASEIVAGVFDNLLNTEYATIATNYSSSELANIDDYNSFYFASKTGGGRASLPEDVNASTFDNLNEIEKNGLDGIISMTSYINGAADRTGSNVTEIATNPFVLTVTGNSSSIRNLFTNKLRTNNTDSRVGKVIFVSRVAKTVEKETTTYDNADPSESGLLVLMKYAINLPTAPLSNPSDYIWTTGYTNDYYDSSFNFATYGNALMNYIDSCTPSI